MAKYLLIDGPSLMFRAFYVLPPMRTASGIPTSALYGFLRMMLKAARETKADGVAVALDIGTPFRGQIYTDYKATREKTPEELTPQFERLPNLLAAMNVPVLGVEGLEADDLIATLAHRLTKEGHEVLILTGDRDLLQLVADRIEVVLTKRGVSDLIRFDATAFEKEYRFPPPLLPDYKALAGDPSDNIPGVPGIGPKTARDLISRFGRLENIFDHLADLKAHLRERLLAHRDRAFEGRMLATLKVTDSADLPTPRSPDLSRPEALAMLQSLEFGSLMASYLPHEPSPGHLFDSVEPLLVREESSLWDEISGAASAGQSSAEGFVRWEDFWEPASVSTDPTRATRGVLSRNGIVMATDGTAWSALEISPRSKGDPVSRIREWLRAEPGRSIFVDDWKSLFAILLKTDSGSPGFVPDFDLSLGAFLVDPEGPTSLNDLLKRYLTDLRLKKPRDLAQAVMRLKEALARDLQQAGLLDVLREWEIPLAEVLVRMEVAGVRVNAEALNELSELWLKETQQLEKTAETMLGKPINLASPKQVARLLFEELGLPRLSKDSTSTEVLEQLKEHHPIVPLIMRYRAVTKLRSTYAEALKSEIETDGKVHTTYLQTGTATGRFSSRDPNLQNIPIHGPEATLIRRAFVPSDDAHEFLSADYSQIDLRLLAHLSADPELIRVFEAGEDIHTETARRMFGITGEVSAEARRRAKAVNFGIIYLMSEYGLSQQLGCSREEAAEIIRSYFERFPGVKRFVEETLAFARQSEYVTTLLGRRRWVRNVNSRNSTVRRAAERVAVNTRVQGSTADLLMMAMVQLSRRIPTHLAAPLIQIHDEILFEVPSENLKNVARSVKMVMESVTKLRVPLVVHLRRGCNWADLEVIDEVDR